MEKMLFQWGKDFATGHPIIDQQHLGLIEMINQLLHSAFQENTGDENGTKSLVKQLTDYTHEHFKTEEAMMAQYSVEATYKAQHFKAHSEFVKKVEMYLGDPTLFENSDKTAEVSEFLIRWLAYHILSMDKSLIRQINKIEQEGMSPSEAYSTEIKADEASTEPLLKALKSLFYIVTQKNIELEQRVKERTAELEEVNRKLETLSYVDELTGLPNRRFAMQEIDKCIQHFIRYNTPFSVLYMDLNKFKSVNDHYGHDSGDEVLKWFSNFVLTHIRKSDSMCRLGGDEFIIIAPYANLDDAVVLAKHLLETSKALKDNEYPSFWEPSFSIGVSEMTGSIKNASELLTLADAAMYDAKKSGSGWSTH